MGFLRWLAIAAAALLALALAAWLLRWPIAGWLLRAEGERARSEYLHVPVDQNVQRYSKTIQEDRAELLKLPIFRPSAGKADAAAFLNPKLGWFRALDASKPQPLDLPPELAQQLAAQPDWLSWKVDWARWKLDFSWLAALSKFDTWSSDANSPAIDERKQYRFDELPTPDLRNLLLWCKLRLLKGEADGDPGPALAEVRQLARLVWTNDSLVSAMVAIKALELETTFALAQTPPVSDPGLIPLSTLRRARRYFYSLGSGLDLRLGDEVWGQWVQDPGLCVAVNEGVSQQMELVRSVLPEDFAAPLRRFGELVDRTAGQCRPSRLRRVWRDPAYPLLFRDDDDVFATVLLGEPEPARPSPMPLRWSELKSHQLLRRTIGYLLLGIAQPDPLRQYAQGLPDAGP